MHPETGVPVDNGLHSGDVHTVEVLQRFYFLIASFLQLHYNLRKQCTTCFRVFNSSSEEPKSYGLAEIHPL